MATTLTFTGNSDLAQRAIANLERKYQSMEQRIKAVGKSTQSAGNDGYDAFIKMGLSAVGIGSALDIATKATNMFRLSYQKLLEMQSKAANANKDLAGSLTDLALNTDTPLPTAKRRVMSIARKTNTEPKQIVDAMNEAQAAKGDLSEHKVDQTIIASAALAKHKPEAMKQLVSVALDIQKQIKGTSPEEAIGFALAAQAKSRVPDATDFNTNVMPAIIDANKIENTPMDYGAALSAGITQASGDKTGRTSRTAMTGLILQLKNSFPELGSTEERINLLRDNPEIKNAFLNGGKFKDKNGKEKSLSKMQFEVQGPDGEMISLDTDHASFERKMVPAIDQLLTHGSPAERMMNDSLSSVPKLQNAAPVYQNRVKEMKADPNLSLADKQNEFGAKAKTNLANNTDAAKADIVRKGVEEQLESLGFDGTYREALKYRVWAQPGKSTTDAYISSLESDRNVHAKKAKVAKGLPGMFPEAAKKEYEINKEWERKYNVVLDMLKPMRDTGIPEYNLNELGGGPTDRERDGTPILRRPNPPDVDETSPASPNTKINDQAGGIDVLNSKLDRLINAIEKNADVTDKNTEALADVGGPSNGISGASMSTSRPARRLNRTGNTEQV